MSLCRDLLIGGPWDFVEILGSLIGRARPVMESGVAIAIRRKWARSAGVDELWACPRRKRDYRAVRQLGK